MNVKIVYCLVVCTFLSGCLTTQNARLSPREIDCAVLSNHLGKDDAWRLTCAQDDNIYVQAYKDDLDKKDARALCYIATHSIDQGRTLAQEVANTKKINCESYRRKFAQEYATSLNMDQICSVWNSGTGDNAKDKAVRAEVKAREVNCPELLATAAQRQAAIAQQMQAQAMQQQAEAQKAQANAALIEALKPPPQPVYIPPPAPVYKAPTHTSCYTIGNRLNCDSY